MRVLLINTSERIGGAAVAASRLKEALKQQDIKVKMLVRDKQTSQLDVISVQRSWRLLLNFAGERFTIWAANRFHKKNLFALDIANRGTDITTLPEFAQADLIHLHWINQGFLSLKILRKIFNSGKPVVWTMHDMWPCTGICHHARECTSFETHCGHCMYLYGKGRKKDLSYFTFKKKQAVYKNAPLTFVACSKWLEGRARKSALLTHKTVTAIPNPINTNLFKPRNKKEARAKLNLPADQRLILFGSAKISDKRKGIDYLIAACKLLHEKYPTLQSEVGVVVFGSHSEILQDALPFKVFPLNYVSDEKDLVTIYDAVDLYATPSLEENLPNMIMEAMACGVPCVGYNVGGIPEMIDHLHNGYVAEYKSAEDFARGMHWILSEPAYAQLSEEAVRKVETHYSEPSVARRYIRLYQQLLKESR